MKAEGLHQGATAPGKEFTITTGHVALMQLKQFVVTYVPECNLNLTGVNVIAKYLRGF